MKTRKYQFAALAVLALLFFPAAGLSQEERPADRGSVEFGVRHVWGEVYGRPDLPFEPSFETSKFNEYRDLRTGFFLRRFNLTLDDILGSKNYVHAQSRSAIYKDQTYLVTFGQYGRYKAQFRYDEIPHTYTNTSRTFYTETAPGVFTISPSIKNTLQTTSAAALPATVLAQVPAMAFITPAIRRKAGTGLVSYNITPDWNISVLFSRENQVGTRPIALLFNSSPSASATSGFGVEVPEAIDYFNNTIRIGTEFGRENWGIQGGYLGSFFRNNIGELVFDNPFRTSDCISPTGCTSATQGPAVGLLDMYPDNTAHYLNIAGALGLGKYLRVMASITPGWLRQNDSFVPYTSHTLRLAQTGPLPAASLNGEKQTLAMNYTLVATPLKAFQLKAGYRHYDYNNNTSSLTFTPVQGDISAPQGATDTHIPGFNKKTVELTGNWFFGKKSSLKVGYEGEWFDRTNRDVENSREDSFIAAVDLSPHKDLLFRLGYRHQNRDPEHYEDELSVDPATGLPVECEATELAAARAAFVFPGIHPCARRFDESERVRDRFDALVQYSPFDKLSLSAFAGTIQDDYNRPGGTNSATPLNFLTGAAATTSPYYLYGLLKDLSYTYGVDATFAFSSAASVFAEYSYERYHKRMTSRLRSPESTTLSSNPNGCGPSSNGLADQGPCDSANNDWESTARDFVHVWSAGVDLFLGKKVYLTTYYTMAAGKGQVFTRALGLQPPNFVAPPGTPNFLTNPSPLTNDPDRFMMTTTSAATDYPAPCLVTGQSCTDIPNTVSRSHDLGAVFKFKLTKNIMPKLEYRFQQFDSRDYQTTAMTPYMGCVATSGVPADPGPPPSPSIGATVATGCPVFGPTTASSLASPFYPFSLVGDSAAARFVFLGVDQPSYRGHYFSATIEYHF